MEKDTRPIMVSICSITYNHAPFIRQCLDSFLMQKTDFRFEVVINDDCSTDGTTDILREYEKKYPDIIKPVYHEENLWSKGIRGMFIRFVFPKAKGKYFALCEGDDYWTDPYKLQKQVDFMEAHPDYGMVHTDFDLTEGTRNHNLVKLQKDDVYFPSILTDGLFVGTLTVLIRKSFLSECPNYTSRMNWPMGDYPMWIELAHISKIKYIPEVTAKYRVLANSASHSTDIHKMIAFKEAGVQIKKFYADLYGVKLDQLYTSYYYECIVRFACRLGNINVAKEYYNMAKQERKLTCKTILYYFCTKYSCLKKILEIYRKV